MRDLLARRIVFISEFTKYSALDFGGGVPYMLGSSVRQLAMFGGEGAFGAVAADRIPSLPQQPPR